MMIALGVVSNAVPLCKYLDPGPSIGYSERVGSLLLQRMLVKKGVILCTGCTSVVRMYPPMTEVATHKPLLTGEPPTTGRPGARLPGTRAARQADPRPSRPAFPSASRRRLWDAGGCVHMFRQLTEDQRRAAFVGVVAQFELFQKSRRIDRLPEAERQVADADLKLLVALRNDIIHTGSPKWSGKEPWADEAAKAGILVSKFASLLERTFLAILEYQGQSDLFDQSCFPAEE